MNREFDKKPLFMTVHATPRYERKLNFFLLIDSTKRCNPVKKDWCIKYRKQLGKGGKMVSILSLTSVFTLFFLQLIPQIVWSRNNHSFFLCNHTSPHHYSHSNCSQPSFLTTVHLIVGISFTFGCSRLPIFLWGCINIRRHHAYQNYQ